MKCAFLSKRKHFGFMQPGKLSPQIFKQIVREFMSLLSMSEVQSKQSLVIDSINSGAHIRWLSESLHIFCIETIFVHNLASTSQKKHFSDWKKKRVKHFSINVFKNFIVDLTIEICWKFISSWTDLPICSVFKHILQNLEINLAKPSFLNSMTMQ